MQKTETKKITMNFLFNRKNRNRHFQIIKENDYITTNRVFTGLGLYYNILESSKLSLVGKFSKEYREDIKNMDEMYELRCKLQDELLECVMIGKNKDALKNDYGEVNVTAGWEYQI